MAAFGARQDDPDSQNIKQTFQYMLKRKALNDAGINIWQGNYGVYLNQIEPNVHDQGYWRIGSIEQPYGRYARGFDNQHGKNHIYLDVDDRMFDEQSEDEGKSVSIRVVYFDEGFGTWELYYDSIHSETPVRALEVSKTNTGEWQEKTIIVEDAFFGNRGPFGADLFLSNKDTENDIFHMVDIQFTERE